MGGVMRLVQRRLGALGWEHLIAGEARIGIGYGVGVGVGIGLRQGRFFRSAASSALSVSTPCWSRSLSTSSPRSLSLSTGSSTSSSSWLSRNRSGIRRYVIFCFVLYLLARLLISTPSSSLPNASYARFRPLIGLCLFSSRLFPPIAGISLLHND